MIIARDIAPQIKQQLFGGKLLIIYWPRQVGKTTFLLSLLEEYSNEAIYINGDYIDNREWLSTQDPVKLKKFIGSKRLVLIDEAQRVPNIGINLKILYDYYPEIQIIATGSSSFDLANEINEPLTWRVITHTMYPISIHEYLQSTGHPATKSILEQYMIYWAYPAIMWMGHDDAVNALQNLVGNYLYKDLLLYEGIRKSSIIIDMLRLLAHQVGQEVSYGEIANKLSINIATVEKYIDLLEKSFVIFRLTAMSRNPRNEVRKSMKIYFLDCGVRNTLIRNFNPIANRDDVWWLWENFCIIERKKYLAYTNTFVNSYFWRNYQQKEIDYLEEIDGNLDCFECKRNDKKKGKLPADFLKTYHALWWYQDITYTTINSAHRESFLGV